MRYDFFLCTLDVESAKVQSADEAIEAAKAMLTAMKDRYFFILGIRFNSHDNEFSHPLSNGPKLKEFVNKKESFAEGMALSAHIISPDFVDSTRRSIVEDLLNALCSRFSNGDRT